MPPAHVPEEWGMSEFGQEEQNQLTNARVFNAPREVVFEAFRNPDHLKHWWGPKGFSNVFERFDFRPGGEWRFTMRGPDGAEYPMLKTFEEIVEPKRIVLQHHQADHRFQLEMVLTEDNGGTRVTWQMTFEPGSWKPELKEFLQQANEENFDRLEALLGRQSTKA